MSIRNSATIFEQALRAWEDIMFIGQVKALLENREPCGPVRHWSEFRSYVLRYRLGDRFDNGRFTFFTTNQVMWGMPYGISSMLTSWITHGKRVYRLSPSMQAMFSKVSFGTMRISDLVFPLKAFGIQCNTVPDTDGNGSDVGMILVSDYPTLLVERVTEEERESTVAFSFFPVSLLSYQALASGEKKLLLSKITEGNARRLPKVLKRVMDTYRTNMSAVTGFEKDGYLLPLNRDQLIEDYFTQLSAGGFPEGDVTQIRIVYNLCVYLQSMACIKKSTGMVRWERDTNRAAPTQSPVLVSETDVCVVEGWGTLDAGVHGGSGSREGTSGGWEVAPHWRSAHKRRPKGKGNDPTAEKTVSVPRTLVRIDKMPDIGTLKGSSKKIT